jgi:excinuclease ABC subunit B
MYADELTDSMKNAIKETNRRRKIQQEYNERHGIVPKSIVKDVRDSIKAVFADEQAPQIRLDKEETLEQTIDRLEIIRELRLGKFDVLVGINLLGEGLDIPEVSLVAILDADKEGFLRSERSLIQTIGRAARNSEGQVIMYADELTDSMENAIRETNRRRKIQEEYNLKHGIVPKSIVKDVRDSVKAVFNDEEAPVIEQEKGETLEETIDRLTKEMFEYARKYEFEKAAVLRDLINELKNNSLDG